MCIHELTKQKKKYIIICPKEYSKFINNFTLDLNNLLLVNIYPKNYIEKVISNIQFLFKNNNQSVPHCFAIETLDNSISVYKCYLK